MSIRTQADIVTAFSQFLKTRFSRIDTTSGRALPSLFFDSIATEIATAYTALDQVQVEQGISAPTTSSTSGLNDLAYNWSLTRRGAVASTGIITFQKKTQPTTTLQIGAQDGTGGIVLSTARSSTGSTVSFVTTETVFLSPTSVLNPATGFYETDAAIKCVVLGTIGNVDAGLITSIQSSVAGVDYATNKITTTGGRKEEDNTTLASRIAKKVQGLQPGISSGLLTVALQQETVLDASVVSPNDSESVRGADAGGVDLVVLGEQLSTFQQVEVYSAGQTTIAFTHLPASAIAYVSAVVGGKLTALTEGTDFSFSQDLSGTYALSMYSDDKLVWLGGTRPDVGTLVNINYQYDKSISAIQAVVDADNNHFITADVLIKRAVQVLVDVSLSVRKLSGYDSTVVSNNVSTAISNLVNNLGLGSPVQQSDLVVAIKAVAGVSSIVLPFTKLCIRGSSGVADVNPTKFQYCRVDSASLSITVI